MIARHAFTLAVVLPLSLVSVVACSKEQPQQPNDLGMQQPTSGAAPAAAQAGARIQGDVLETMNSGGYTYVLVKTADGKQLWTAGPETTIKVGDKVSTPEGLAMSNYKSTSLDRTFDVVYFVQAISVNGQMPVGKPGTPAVAGAPGAADPHAGVPGAPGNQAAAVPPAAAPVKVDLTNIKKAEGGKTIAETFAQKDALSGKAVTIRARVVKFNANIMGKNWLHLQDGSGSAGTNDLTITSATGAKVGDLVVAQGTLTLNKDFGAGYKYDVIMEEAKLKIE